MLSFFFFSSRRRHTRSLCDWSSDVCSSDLLTPENLQNQVDVVKEEILVNVKNQPYGGFPWLYLPMALFTTFPNAHDAYGDFADLDAATLEDAADFFDRYYSPSNAVLAIAGDVDPDDAAAIIERHFDSIEERPAPP